ncbi:MAG TPA: hypothetical protein VMT17_04515 [Anaeromyxobacteraceae bacterium]|nr:hypothetical protein [Anaeromyxobacteraceae bacterium]
MRRGGNRALAEEMFTRLGDFTAARLQRDDAPKRERRLSGPVEHAVEHERLLMAIRRTRAEHGAGSGAHVADLRARRAGHVRAAGGPLLDWPGGREMRARKERRSGGSVAR